jgi:hypothetical protein
MNPQLPASAFRACAYKRPCLASRSHARSSSRPFGAQRTHAGQGATRPRGAGKGAEPACRGLLRPHLMHRVDRRSRSLEVSGPHLMIKGTKATGVRCSGLPSGNTLLQGIAVLDHHWRCPVAQACLLPKSRRRNMTWQTRPGRAFAGLSHSRLRDRSGR